MSKRVYNRPGNVDDGQFLDPKIMIKLVENMVENEGNESNGFKIIKRVFVMFLWVESGQFLHHPRIIIKPGKCLLKLVERPGNVVPKLKSCGK